MYFVVECTTTSAPSARGCCRYGVANVLSTTSSAPAARHIAAIAAMSLTPSNGLVGVSTHTTLVLPGSIAASTASRSVRSTGVWSMPHGPNTRAMSRYVPPYASSPMTTWSPGRRIARSSVSSAASPEANAYPCAPPSTAARASSSAARVGLAEREYSYPPRSPPTPSCL